MDKFIILSKDDYTSVLPVEVVAFHFSNPGACGYHGVIRLITRDRRQYMVRYLYDVWPSEALAEVCPPFDEIKHSYQNMGPLPAGWVRINMGLGNSRFVRGDIRQHMSVAGMMPPQIYQQWEEMVLNAIERLDNPSAVTAHGNPDRVSPDDIESLDDNDVFVFGSNIFGFHDGGASERALLRFGAVYGQPEGMQGQSYAIPTDGVTYSNLVGHIREFIQYAGEHPETRFLVTRIGCGTAGYDESQIAPLFVQATSLENVLLPADFWKYLK